MLTAAFLNWTDLARINSASAGSGAPASIARALTDFFDSINLLLNESMQKSFYVLNGSLVFYLAVGFAALARGVVPFLDVETMRKNIFKIISAAASLIIAVVLLCFWLVGR